MVELKTCPECGENLVQERLGSETTAWGHRLHMARALLTVFLILAIPVYFVLLLIFPRGPSPLYLFALLVPYWLLGSIQDHRMFRCPVLNQRCLGCFVRKTVSLEVGVNRRSHVG